jgi:hypothetical protein
VGVSEREQVAQRLIGGSLKRSFDPGVDIAWDAPLEDDKWFRSPEAVSLFGTPLWEAMTDEQRRTLAREETANTLSMGVWFENTLNQGLLRTMLFQDPTSAHVHYSLIELGDETRHMVMFGRAVARMGARPYRLTRPQALAVQAFPLVYRGLFLWVAALCGEEWIDQAQRDQMRNPVVQPLIRRLMQIHVTEEARHIKFAREGVRRRVQRAPWWERAFARNANGLAAFVIHRMSVSREVYRRCGLDPSEAVRQAMANPHLLEPRQRYFAPMREFFEGQGLLNGFSRAVWRRYGFIA